VGTYTLGQSVEYAVSSVVVHAPGGSPGIGRAPALVYLSLCLQSRIVKVVPNVPWEYLAINLLVSSPYTLYGAAAVPATAVNCAGSAGGCPSGVGDCVSAAAIQAVPARKVIAMNTIA